MKTPITREDIRKGDLIRAEYPDGDGGIQAVEYVAQSDHLGRAGAHVYYFLLDRPVPPVILPTEPGAYIDAEGDLWEIHPGSHMLHFRSGETDAEPANFAPFTKLEPVADTAKRVIERMASWWEFGPPKKFQDEFNDIAAEFGVK